MAFRVLTRDELSKKIEELFVKKTQHKKTINRIESEITKYENKILKLDLKDLKIKKKTKT